MLGDQRQVELAAEGQRLLDAIQGESEQVKEVLKKVIVDARAEFDGVKEQQKRVVEAAAKEFEDLRTKQQQVVEAAAEEFKKQQQSQEQQRQDLQTLYQAIRIEMAQINEKIEAGITEGGSTSGKKDVQYLPDKQMIPDEYEGQLEEWRERIMSLWTWAETV